MRKIAIAVMILIVTISIANAEISGNISTKLVSRYIANNGFVLHNKATQQTDLFILMPQGFYADLWISLPWDGKENLGKEADMTIGWNGAIGSTGVVADLGISYFNYISLSRSDDDMINPYAKISKDFTIAENQILSPYVKIETPFPARDRSLKGGIYTNFGIKHTWKIAKKISFSQDICAVYDNGAYELENGWIGKYNATASVQLGKGYSLDLSLSVFTPLTTFSDRKTEKVPSIGLIYSF